MTERINSINLSFRFGTSQTKPIGDQNNVDDAEMPPNVNDANDLQGDGPDIGQNPGIAGVPEREEIALPSNWQQQLDALLIQASQMEYGNVTYDELVEELDRQPDLPEILKDAILDAQDNLTQSMNSLHALTGTQIIEAFRTSDKSVTDIIDNAVASQHNLAAKLRTLKAGNPAYTVALENMADKCDRRASEITCAVLSVLNPPGAEEILQEMGRIPPALTGLKNELLASGFSSRQSKAVNQAYDNAVKALEALGKSDAISLSEEITGNPDCQHRLFDEAVDALDKLSTAIHNLRSKAHYTEALEELAMAVDHHIAHLATLGNELPTLLEARKDKNVQELMIASISEMHGTQAVLTRFKEDLSPILEKLDDFEKHPQNIHSPYDLTQLHFRLVSFREDLSNILRDGHIVLRDGSRFILDQPLINSLHSLIDKAQASIDKFRTFFSKPNQQLSIATRQTFPPVSINPILNSSRFFVETFPTLAKIGEYSRKYRVLETKVFQHPEEALDELKQLNERLRNDTKDIRRIMNYEHSRLCKLQECIKLHKNHQPIPAGPAADILNRMLSLPEQEQAIIDEIEAIDSTQVSHFTKQFISRDEYNQDYHLRRLEHIFKSQMDNSGLRQSFMQGAKIRKAMQENIPLSTIIESRLNGASPDMIDELCDDSNLAEDPAELSHGQANTVYLCNFTNPLGDTEQKIFKSEYKGSLGNLGIMLGYTGAPTNQTAFLNISSKKIADVLNIGERIPKSSVGMLKGEYGLFMDFVEGFSPKELKQSSGPARRSVGPMLSKHEMLSLSQENKAKVRWQLMKQCNQLQWTDLLTAQGDRHGDNYKIAINRDFEVELQGIDNDACLMEWKVGISKVKITPAYFNLLKNALFATTNEFNQFIGELRANNAILEAGENSLTLDTAKMTLEQQEKLHNILGFQSFKVPDYMDFDVFLGLMDLEQHPNKFQESLPPDLTPQARASAFNRLQEMIETAHRYHQDGKILMDHDWQSPDRQQEMYDLYKQRRTAAMLPQKTLNMGQDMFFRDLAEMF